MSQTNIEKDPTKNDVIEGINYREMWDKFEDAAVSYNKSPMSYESVLFGLKEIEGEVNTAVKDLENKRMRYQYIKDNLPYQLGPDRITDYSWILSIMLAKRTMDMIWLKSEHGTREKEQGEGNCDAHRKLLDRYCRILKDIAETYDAQKD